MVKIPNLQDPTLVAIDEALERTQESRPRNYLGASGVGETCERKLWAGFRWVKDRHIEASGLRRMTDGHPGELVVADMLRLVEGSELSTEREPGQQLRTFYQPRPCPAAVARVLHEAGYELVEQITRPHPQRPRRFERVTGTVTRCR